MVWGAISAAVSPWTARAAINTEALGASAHASDAVMKPARPFRKTRLGPYRSPRRPARIRGTA